MQKELEEAILKGMGQETPLIKDDEDTLISDIKPDEEAADDAETDDKAEDDKADAAAEDAEKKEGDEAAAEIDKDKKPDAVEKGAKEEAETNDDDIVKNLSEKGKVRFKKLTGDLKSKDEELTKTRSQLEDFGRILVDHHVDKQVFNNVLQYSKALATNDIPTARKLLNEQIKAFTLATGQQISLDEADALAEYPDLRAKVDSLDLDEGMALEIAKHRAREKGQQVQQQTQQQAEQSSQQQSAVIDKAMNGIDAWAQDMATKHLDWAMIEDRLQGQIDRIVKNTPPHTWLVQLQNAADLLITSSSIKPNKRTPTPLTTKSSSSGAKEPANAFEAAMMAIGTPTS